MENFRYGGQRPRPDGPSVKVGARISQEEAKRLEEIAKAKEVSVSDVLREALAEAMLSWYGELGQ